MNSGFQRIFSLLLCLAVIVGSQGASVHQAMAQTARANPVVVVPGGAQAVVGALTREPGPVSMLQLGLETSMGLDPDLLGAFGTRGSPPLTAVGERDERIGKEAEEMLGLGRRKPEVLFPDFYRGALDLGALSRARIQMEPERQVRIDALVQLIRIGLRPVGLPEEAERAALAALESPTPAMGTLLAELGLDVARLRTAVLDVHRIDRENDIPPAVLARARDLGLLRLKIPKAYGGLGLDQREYAEALKALAGIAGSVGAAISAHSTIGSAPLLMFGTEAQKKNYLRMFSKGEALAAFGLTEPTAGTDLSRLGTTAVLSEDGRTFRLNGEKLFITGIMDAGLLYVVSGRTMVEGRDVGPSVFMVDLPFTVDEDWGAKKAKLRALDRRGMRITPFTHDALELMMIRGTDQGFIQLRDLPVPAENVLGPLGKDKSGLDGRMVPLLSLNKGRAGFGPYVSEAAAWLATRFLGWSVDRKMFDMYSPGKGVEGRAAHMERTAARLGRAHMKVAALRAVSELTSALIDENPESGVAALSAAIKVRVSEQGWDIAQDTLEAGGGHFLIKGAPNSVELAFRDMWITRVVEGVNGAMAQFVHVIAGGAVEREMRTLRGVIRFLWNQFVSRAVPWAVTSKGALPLREAKWIQRRTARFAMRFGLTAKRLGHAEFARRQNTLVRAYNVEMDLFTLAAVLLKLEREKGRLQDAERITLEGAAQDLKASIDRELPYISPKGHPGERLDLEVGQAVVQAALAAEGGRANLQEEHLSWLRRRALSFHDRLRQESQ